MSFAEGKAVATRMQMPYFEIKHSEVSNFREFLAFNLLPIMALLSLLDHNRHPSLRYPYFVILSSFLKAGRIDERTTVKEVFKNNFPFEKHFATAPRLLLSFI